MKFEDYWENYGELHASMCGGDIKQFAKEIWMSANVKTEELKEAAIALVQRLELDKDVKNNNWRMICHCIHPSYIIGQPTRS